MGSEKKVNDISSFCPYNKPRKVRITVEKLTQHDVHGTCHMHSLGETFTFGFERCPENFCAAAWHSLWPALRVVELGGQHPWDEEKGITRVGCPDPNIPVVFRIETFEE